MVAPLPPASAALSATSRMSAVQDMARLQRLLFEVEREFVRTAPTLIYRVGEPELKYLLCQHIWEHYAFTGDTQFLREQYPVLKGAAQFFLDVMVEEPKHHWLVTPFSMSPEHGYLDANGKLAFLSPGPTMDVGILRELFPHLGWPLTGRGITHPQSGSTERTPSRQLTEMQRDCVRWDHDSLRDCRWRMHMDFGTRRCID